MQVVRDFIREQLKRISGLKMDPDRVVALGAAVQAGLCSNDAAVSDIVLTDVCPHTLGIEMSKNLLNGRPEVLIFELEHHSIAATFAVIDRLDQSENHGGVKSLAQRLLYHRERIKTPAGGIAVSRLACAAAFWARDMVEPLADFAYENLARGERDFHMALIDRHVAIAGLLETVPDAHSEFWRRRLIDNSNHEEWKSDAATAALRWLGSPTGSRNSAAEILRSLVPDDAADTFGFSRFSPFEPSAGSGTELEPCQTSARESTTSGGGETYSWESDNRPPKPRGVVHTPPPRSRERTGIPWRIALVFLFPIVKILSMLGENGTPSYTPHDYNPSRIEDLKLISAEELLREMDNKKTTTAPEVTEWLKERERKDHEFAPPGSTKNMDPSTNPYLKLLEEPPPRGR